MGWFDHLPNGCIDNWMDIYEAFVEWFALRRKCCKDLTEVAKIVRRANETLPNFKERWTEEMSYIPDVPVFMQISALRSNSKCPEVARRFSDQLPQTVTEMMKRVDDFVKSEEETIKSRYLPMGRSLLTIRNSSSTRRKSLYKQSEEWIDVPIMFHPVSTDDVSDGPLIVEFMDQREAVQVMFEHCFNNLSPDIKGQLAPTQTELEGFSGEQLTPIGKIKLKVCFREGAQKQRVLGTGKSKVVTREVEEWLKAGIVRPVKYPTWISNPVLVKKADGTWRMCIDLKNLNSACPKDYYPLPKINLKIKAIMRHPFKWKFLGYMVTSKGIRANPKKTKAIADMQSPKTLKEMESLSGKLAALNRFLSRSAERSLLFFKILKNITKENKEDYSWIKEAKHAFHELKKFILELPTLTTPKLKNTIRAYNIAYISRTAVKGQILADFINEILARTQRVEACNSVGEEDLKGWTLYTDGASTQKGTKNSVKEKVQMLDVKVDSKLVAFQMNGEFVARNKAMAKYMAKAKEQATLFKKFLTKNIPRNQNQKADVLSKLASVAFNHLTKEILAEVLNSWFVDVQEVSTIVEEEEDNWMTPIIKCLEERVCPTYKNEARTLRIKIDQYVVKEGLLFKKSYLSPMLRCVGPLQQNYIIRKVHERECEMHAGSRSIVANIMRQGYYCQTMHGDTKEVGDKCDSCQIHVPVPKLPKTWLTSIMSLWSFYQRGLDILGPLLEGPDKLKFIIVAIDYFTKWIEGNLLAKTTEIGMPTYRTIPFNESQNEEEMRLNLDLLQERRETTAIQEAKYKNNVEQYYNKRVGPMSFKVGDFVSKDNQVVVLKGMSEVVFVEVDGGCWIVLSAAAPKVTPTGEGASGCTNHNSLNGKSHESAIFWTYGLDPKRSNSAKYRHKDHFELPSWVRIDYPPAHGLDERIGMIELYKKTTSVRKIMRIKETGHSKRRTYYWVLIDIMMVKKRKRLQGGRRKMGPLNPPVQVVPHITQYTMTEACPSLFLEGVSEDRCFVWTIVVNMYVPMDSWSDAVSYHPLILTLEFGPGVTPGERLTRVVPLCVGATPHQWPEISSDTGRLPKQETASTNWRHPHISSLKALVQKHNESPTGLLKPIWLSFDNEGGPEEEHNEELEDLQKPYKLAKGWFDCLPNGCIDNWTDLCEAFIKRFALRRKCCKDPTEVAKIVRRANKMLTDFKERWTKEMSYISNVLVFMQISACMSNSNRPEFARRFSDQGTPEESSGRAIQGKRSSSPFIWQQTIESRYLPIGRSQSTIRNSLSTRRKHPQKKNLDRYCEYHGEKGHYTNDCFHKKQLKIALEFGKLNHLIKDVRQRGGDRGRQTGNNNGWRKVINIVRQSNNGLKHKSLYKQSEEWVDVPILQVMLEHCFDNLSSDIKARLAPTQMELVGFLGEQLIPIWKIELKVCFGEGGLTQNAIMKFTVVQASSPYNIILGRTGLIELWEISSTIHGMRKFPTPKGIATICAQAKPIYECR
nr:reverse transcriptase domain-containing protein [Tanacetum cinerariifolium]